MCFGPDLHGIIGDPTYYAFLKGITLSSMFTGNDAGIPLIVHVAYQMMFAIITPALITGAFAERMKFSAFVVFSLLWATLVYDPLAHMVWGGGIIGTTWGAIDFAGGTVVHISSGMSALVCALVIGKRLGYGSDPGRRTTRRSPSPARRCGSAGSASTPAARRRQRTRRVRTSLRPTPRRRPPRSAGCWSSG
jgi:ammonia channel protein AmtB